MNLLLMTSASDKYYHNTNFHLLSKQGSSWMTKMLCYLNKTHFLKKF